MVGVPCINAICTIGRSIENLVSVFDNAWNSCGGSESCELISDVLDNCERDGKVNAVEEIEEECEFELSMRSYYTGITNVAEPYGGFLLLRNYRFKMFC